MRAMVHKDRYMQAFYSAPHKRPPMCLQYAIWTVSASRHEKYGRYHGLFYRRARQYLEADELKVSQLEWEIYGTHADAAAGIWRTLYHTVSRSSLGSAGCIRSWMYAILEGCHQLS